MNIKKNCIIILATCLTLISHAQIIGLEWAKQIGGNGGGVGRAITTDANGDVFTTGYFSGTVDFDPGTGVQDLTSVGNSDIFVQKLDAGGNFLWVKQMEATVSGEGQSITIDTDGSVYTTGYFHETTDFDPGPGVQNLTSAGSSDIFILKLDDSGNFLWTKQIAGSGSSIGQSIATDATHHVYITGSFNGTADFDPGLGVQNFTSAGSNDIFIQKLDIDGNFLWAKRMGGQNFDAGYSINLDPDRNVYTTGTFRGVLNINPNSNLQTFTSAGYADIFIQKLDTDGNFIWGTHTGGNGNDFGHSSCIDTDGSVYTTGYFQETVDFDPGPGVQNLTAGGGDVYIQKLGTSTIGLQDYSAEDKSFTIYPNPNDGQFTITFEAVLSNVEVNIVDVHGRLIHSSQHQHTDKIDLELNHPAGVYHLEIKTPKGKKAISLIKKS